MNKLNILGSYFLVITGLIACEQANQKAAVEKKVNPAPKSITVVPVKPTLYTDTLFIQDDFASQPFRLDSVSVLTVQHLLRTNQLIKKPVTNKFSEQQIDTLITIRKGKSYIQLYGVSAEENKFYFQSASIQDSLPVFSQALQIGHTKEQVKQAIKSLAEQQSLPDIIQISNSAGTDFLYLVFQNNKLAKVKFLPYLD